MPSTRLKIIRNSKRTPCSRCQRVHEYLGRPTDGKLCDIPTAYPEDKAKQIAPMLANGVDDVTDIPTGTDVILAEGARKLPERGEPKLAQYENRTMLA